MEKMKVEPGSVQETLIIPLYGRKMCNVYFPEIFTDRDADRIIESVDYDFSKVQKKWESKRYRFGALEVAMRQTDLQWEVRDYLKTHPQAAVVNMGCGLDSTGRACDNGTCRIYNIDMPDVIDARNELLPAGDREVNIAADLTDTSWLDRIDASGGAVLFASGVFYYIEVDKLRSLFQEMERRLPGARVVFDSVNSKGAKMMRKTALKDSGTQDVPVPFHIDDIEDFREWFSKSTVTSRPYMNGYTDLSKRKEVTRMMRFLANMADGSYGMAIYRVDLRSATSPPALCVGGDSSFFVLFVLFRSIVRTKERKKTRSSWNNPQGNT